MTEQMSEMIKRAALLEIEFLAETRRAVLEQHAAAFKWLNASLFAINGGGIIAVLAAHELSAVSKKMACTAFVAGILFALMSGRLGQTISLLSLKPIQNQSGYWLSVAIDGERDEDCERKLEADAKRAMKWGWTGQACGWASIVAFLVGAAFVGLALK